MTNIILWIVIGSATGWICYSHLNLNLQRGLMASILIGLLGGFLGGKVLAPMVSSGDAAVTAGDLSPFPLFMALAGAVAILIITSMIHKRFGF